MNDKQREFLTAIIKVAFTILFGGMAAWKLFALDLKAIHYTVTSICI